MNQIYEVLLTATLKARGWTPSTVTVTLFSVGSRCRWQTRRPEEQKRFCQLQQSGGSNLLTLNAYTTDLKVRRLIIRVSHSMAAAITWWRRGQIHGKCLELLRNHKTPITSVVACALNVTPY